mmetsp:Transcript_65679/g.186382  ORF Transcript_65679/g.186382 Transcript_65679/m.186382 type:complete len:235 (+) Transcript_65679:305-1009(+)
MAAAPFCLQQRCAHCCGACSAGRGSTRRCRVPDKHQHRSCRLAGPRFPWRASAATTRPRPWRVAARRGPCGEAAVHLRGTGRPRQNPLVWLVASPGCRRPAGLHLCLCQEVRQRVRSPGIGGRGDRWRDDVHAASVDGTTGIALLVGPGFGASIGRWVHRSPLCIDGQRHCQRLRGCTALPCRSGRHCPHRIHHGHRLCSPGSALGGSTTSSDPDWGIAHAGGRRGHGGHARAG